MEKDFDIPFDVNETPLTHPRAPNREHGVAGAASSITAPPNPNQVLRSGIDSLYLSFSGKISEEKETLLSILKTYAQSGSPEIVAEAVLPIGEHNFLVLDKGSRGFPYVIKDGVFNIQINGRPKANFPLIHAQISSSYLAHKPIQEAAEALKEVALFLGITDGIAKVSRVDQFIDFCTDFPVHEIPPEAFVTRARKNATYRDGVDFNGYLYGAGGHILFRLYDKCAEIESKSDDTWLYDLWKKAGWDGERPVLRGEFQTRREALQSFSIPLSTITDIEELQFSLWEYLTRWIRITTPNPDDDHRERWDNTELWESIRWGYGTVPNQPMLERCFLSRVPSDEYLFKHGLAGLTSWAVKYSVDDPDKAVQRWYSGAKTYHNRHTKGGFQAYFGLKYAEKRREFFLPNSTKPPF